VTAVAAGNATRGLPIEIRGLTKRFGSVVAVNDLSFTVEPGRVTGFLGPNGSGKTTGLLIALARAIFHYDLNWLPNAAGAALAGDIARGFGGGGNRTGERLLAWWQGGLVTLAWGLVPLGIGYYTTFRRDVT
jgi:hypothetical protein